MDNTFGGEMDIIEDEEFINIDNDIDDSEDSDNDDDESDDD